MSRGMDTPLDGTFFTGDDTGLFLRTPRPWWWHICPVEQGWVLTQLPNHTISGESPHLTIRASILCTDCGKHGFITDGKWAEA